MSFKSEVRDFMKEVRDKLNRDLAVIQILENRIDKLEEQNDKLLDRIMAEDFPTLQTYTINKGTDASMVSYDPMTDPENAGEVLELNED